LWTVALSVNYIDVTDSTTAPNMPADPGGRVHPTRKTPASGLPALNSVHAAGSSLEEPDRE